MMKRVRRLGLFSFLFWALTLLTVSVTHAQRAQDNWYLDRGWSKSGSTFAATNGGLSQPYGVAIGLDGRMFIGDQGYGRVQVYTFEGSYMFSITNGFGGGLSFSYPRGMIVGPDGKLYVADQGYNKVYVFTQDGTFVRSIGAGTGSGAGQMSGVNDVGVSRDGEVFVLEASRVSVFSPTGQFLFSWGGYGSLIGQFTAPLSLAVAPNGQVFVSDGNVIKVFSREGIYIRQLTIDELSATSDGTPMWTQRAACSLRFDYSGLLHALAGCYWMPHVTWFEVTHFVLNADGGVIYYRDIWTGSDYAATLNWPCTATGRNGAFVTFNRDTRGGYRFRQAFREQYVPPDNAIPQPAVIKVQQRPNSPLVDIDYQVTDADDTNVYACMVGFTNTTQSLATCLRSMTFAEGTETNLGAVITANQPHRVTWNVGADLNTKLVDFRVALLAKDSRQKLLDIHYIRLPADRGMPALKISRSPLVPNDFMQVWWWLLATQDAGIRLTGGKIYGSGGALDTKLLCDATGTTADGRTYIYAKMNVREATSQELQFAKEGALAGNVNQWTPSGITVAGRPKNVNEYGFDTGSWGTSAWWVVPLY